MKDYSQNGEQKIILDYFKDFKGTLLDIGANDGETLSNSRALMLMGWTGVLVEPSKITESKLRQLYKGNYCAIIIPYGISNVAGKTKFYESGTHLGQGDTSLISTVKESELERWKGSKFDNFTETEIQCITFIDLQNLSGRFKYDFITIDAEGLDYEILTQIDLSETKMLIVETNSIEDQKYIDYCKGFGLKVAHKNVENLIFIR